MKWLRTLLRRLRKFGQPAVPRIVLDTNVLVSGIISHGPPAQIIDAVYSGRLQLIISPTLLSEFQEVIKRPHIRRKYPALEERLDPLLDYLCTMTIVVPGVPSELFTPDDPDDDWVIACAIEGQADFIVSGDPHLKALQTVRGIRVLTPRQFVDSVLS